MGNFAEPRQPQRSAADHPVPLKEWTSLDHLTHDFLNCAGYRQHCLETRGQYMTHDGRRVTA